MKNDFTGFLARTCARLPEQHRAQETLRQRDDIPSSLPSPHLACGFSFYNSLEGTTFIVSLSICTCLTKNTLKFLLLPRKISNLVK